MLWGRTFVQGKGRWGNWVSSTSQFESKIFLRDLIRNSGTRRMAKKRNVADLCAEVVGEPARSRGGGGRANLEIAQNVELENFAIYAFMTLRKQMAIGWFRSGERMPLFSFLIFSFCGLRKVFLRDSHISHVTRCSTPPRHL